jgi:hypothetical protein
MKKTIKTILAILALILITTPMYGLYQYKNKQAVVEPSPIDLIMQEPTFQASMKIQAENIHLDRQKAIIEKRKEELRKEELNLASTTTSLKE